MKSQARPPRLATWVATKLIHHKPSEELLGDLQELYEERMSAKGKFQASLMYWFEVIQLIFGFNRHSPLVKSGYAPPRRIGFMMNYVKIAVRRIANDAFVSWINVIGLVSGISICLFILVYIVDEESFDDFYPNSGEVCRVYSRWDFNKDDPKYYVASPYMDAEDALPQLPGVASIVNFMAVPQPIISYQDNSFDQRGVFFADENVFEFFPFKFVAGNASQALTTSSSMVITQSAAKKIFGRDDVLGEVITFRFANTSNELTVTGVVEDAAHNSSWRPSVLISPRVYEKLFEDFRNNWTTLGWETYFRLNKASLHGEAEGNLEKLVTRKAGKRKFYALFLQPLTDVHLNKEGRPIVSKGSHDLLFVLSSIGLFILILACSNYINLTTSRLSLRDKEIALRKVNGARTGDLIRQFYIECAILCTVSFVAAAILVAALLPLFNAATGKDLPLRFFADWKIVAGIAATYAITVLLSGCYPGIQLAKKSTIINTLSALKVPSSGGSFRQYLVVFQMVVATVLLISSMLIIQQMQFITTKEIGLNKEHLLIIDLNDLPMARKYQVLKKEFAGLPGVRSVSASGIVPLYGAGQVHFDMGPESGMINQMIVDEAFGDTYLLKLREGRWLSDSVSTDMNEAVVLNESAVKFFGLDSPIGQEIQLSGNTVQKTKVVGVVEDFNYAPLFGSIAPLVMHMDTTDLGFYFPYRKLALKLEEGSVDATMEAISAKWTELSGFVPFSYSFFDESFNNAYETERRISWLLNVATFLAGLIVCLGLAGLSFFVSEVRKREIAIRKVLGAQVWHIISLLTSKYLRLAFVAFLISVPIAHYIVKEWLDNFAFKADISPMVYVAGLVGLVSICWGLTALNTYRSAKENPAKVLRG